MPHLLVDAGPIKASLGILSTDTDQDALLIEIENRAAFVAEARTNRNLVAVIAYVELTQGNGTPAVFARSPFHAKPTVELRSTVTEAWATLDAALVEVDLEPPDTEARRRRVIRLSNDTVVGGANNFADAGSAGVWFDNVRLTYDAGYALVAAAPIDATPLDLAQAIIDMVTETYRRRIKRTGSQGGDSKEAAGGVVIPSAAAEILELYTTRRHKATGRLELA